MSYQPIKLSPIRARGSAVVERAGWKIAEAYSTPEAEATAARRGAGLADLSAWGKITIQGAEALPVLQQVFGAAPAEAGGATAADGGLLACLAHDEWYLTTPPGGEGQALERVQEALTTAGAFAHAVDMTHANAALLLAGPKSPEALAKLCGLDFRNKSFPNRTAKQSSVARVRAILIRDDLPGGLPAYHLHVTRSEADYLWQTLLDAASEFEAQPMGAAALAALASHAE